MSLIILKNKIFNIFGAFFMKCQDRYHVISLSFFYKLFLISPYLSTSEEGLFSRKAVTGS